MPRGDKSKYTDKQERKADHIAEGYEQRGVSDKEAERRAWATVNKEDGGGKQSGSAAARRAITPRRRKAGANRRIPALTPSVPRLRRRAPRRESATPGAMPTFKAPPLCACPRQRGAAVACAVANTAPLSGNQRAVCGLNPHETGFGAPLRAPIV